MLNSKLKLIPWTWSWNWSNRYRLESFHGKARCNRFRDGIDWKDGLIRSKWKVTGDKLINRHRKWMLQSSTCDWIRNGLRCFWLGPYPAECQQFQLPSYLQQKKPGHKRKIERPPMNNHRSINSKFLSWLQRAISLILHQSVEFNAIHLRSTIMRTFIRQTVQWQINRRKTNLITKNSPLKSVRSIETWNIAIIDTDSVMNKVSIIESNYSIKLSYSPLISSTINW